MKLFILSSVVVKGWVVKQQGEYISKTFSYDPEHGDAAERYRREKDVLNALEVHKSMCMVEKNLFPRLTPMKSFVKIHSGRLAVP